MSGKGHEHSWYWPTSLPCPRHCYRCGIQHPDDAMPPLVAASPVPPVVPDSEALDFPPAFGGCSCSCHTMGTSHVRACCWPSGSGVVPDKPALDLGDFRCAGCNELPDSCECAVTDDEAATTVIAETLPNAPYTFDKDCEFSFLDCPNAARDVVRALHAAGFLLVRDHTKET